MARSLVNGVKRALSSPKRAISLLVFALYYYFILFRRMGAQTAPSPAAFHAMPQLSFPSFEKLDSILFGIFMVVSFAMMAGVLSYRGGFRPADVDVLFPTPVSPKVVLTFRLLRDYLFTLLAPILFLLITWGSSSQALRVLFRNFPRESGDVLRMTSVAWLLLSLGWVSLSYGISMYVGRSDLKSDRNRILIGVGIGVLFAAVALYATLWLHNDPSMDSVFALLRSVPLRVVFFPAAFATDIVMSTLYGNFLALALSLAGSATIVAVGLGLAMTQVDWLYDQAAARGFDSINQRKMRRAGNTYGILADQARRGKLRQSKIAGYFAKKSFSGGAGLLWKEMVMQARGTMPGGLVMCVVFVGIGGCLSYVTRTIGAQGDPGYATMGYMSFITFIYAMMIGWAGFQEMLARVDLLKPLPFSAGKIVFWEVAAKAPLVAGVLGIVAVVSVIVNPACWQGAAAGMLLAVPLLMELIASIAFTRVLFPDFDDPTQRSLNGLVMMFSIVVGTSPGLGLFFLLIGLAGSPSILAAIPAGVLLLATTSAVATITGMLYAGYNPSE